MVRGRLAGGFGRRVPPAAEHVAINRAGLHFTFAISEPEQLMAHADQLGVAAELPRSNALHVIPASGTSLRFGEELHGLTRAALAGAPFERSSGRVLDAFACLLAGDPPAREHTAGRGLDSRSMLPRVNRTRSRWPLR